MVFRGFRMQDPHMWHGPRASSFWTRSACGWFTSKHLKPRSKQMSQQKYCACHSVSLLYVVFFTVIQWPGVEEHLGTKLLFGDRKGGLNIQHSNQVYSSTAYTQPSHSFCTLASSVFSLREWRQNWLMAFWKIWAMHANYLYPTVGPSSGFQKHCEPMSTHLFPTNRNDCDHLPRAPCKLPRVFSSFQSWPWIAMDDLLEHLWEDLWSFWSPLADFFQQNLGRMGCQNGTLHHLPLLIIATRSTKEPRTLRWLT